MNLDEGPQELEVQPAEDLSPTILERATQKASELDQKYGLKEVVAGTAAAGSLIYLAKDTSVNLNLPETIFPERLRSRRQKHGTVAKQTLHNLL